MRLKRNHDSGTRSGLKPDDIVIYYRASKPLAPPAARRTTGNAKHGVTDLFSFRTPQELSPKLPDDLETADKRALIERMRALASQI